MERGNSFASKCFQVAIVIEPTANERTAVPLIGLISYFFEALWTQEPLFVIISRDLTRFWGK